MKKIDFKTQNAFLDGELSESESKLIEDKIKNNIEFKNQIKITTNLNHSIKNEYDEILYEKIPDKFYTLLSEENESFFEKIINYKLSLIPALSICALFCFVVIVGFHSSTFISFKNMNFKSASLENSSKNLILNELEKYMDNEDVASLANLLNKKIINYKIITKFKNNANQSCLIYQFEKFQINDLKIDEVIFCDKNGKQKIVKISFVKGKIADI